MASVANSGDNKVSDGKNSLKVVNEDALVLVQESQTSLQSISRASNFAKAIEQAQRETNQNKFSIERQKRFINYLSKLDWEAEESEVPDPLWDTFFELVESMLTSPDIIGLVCPTLNVLTSLFSHKCELVERSELMDSDTLVEMNLGKLLSA